MGSCDDEFLNLSVPWNLDTGDYLNLVHELGLHNASLAELDGLDYNEQEMILERFIKSPQLRASFALDLFCWTATALWKTNENLYNKNSTSDGSIFAKIFALWSEYWAQADESTAGFDRSPISSQRQHPARLLGVKVAEESYLISSRQKSFVTICRSLRQQLEQPNVLRNTLSLCFEMPSTNSVDDYINWIERTLNQRSPGWKSFVKLKLQFFDVFPVASIDEHFARAVEECCLQLDLCVIIDRIARQHQMDPRRQPQAVLQLGCELLLSVSSLNKNAIPAMRQQLFTTSHGDVRMPLFGALDVWKINIDTQITSTLNQIVVESDSGPQDASHISRTLNKISIVDPYRVVYRLVLNAVHNKGQSPVILQVLFSLERLAFLRRSANDKALLLLVVDDIIAHRSPGLDLSRQQQSNLEEFIRRAALEEPVLIDPQELIEKCALSLLNITLEVAHANMPYLNVLTNVLQHIYLLTEKCIGSHSSAFTQEFLLGAATWMDREMHWRLLLRLLRLGTAERAWDGDEEGSYSERRAAGVAEEGIMDLIELLVRLIGTRLQNITNKETDQYARYAAELFKDIENAEDINRSLALLTSPLVPICQSKLAINVSFSPLPAQISSFCGENLKHYSYDEISGSLMSSCPTMDQYTGALLLLFATGRLSDHVLQDIIQAMETSWTSPSEKEELETITFASVYRIMSISTKKEIRRLLTGCLPAVVKGLGEETLKNLTRFPSSLNVDNMDRISLETNEENRRDLLRSYWQKALEPGVTMHAALATNVITQLIYMERLIDLALSPLSQNHDLRVRHALVRVYAYDIGFDLMVDEVVTSVLLSSKAYDVDWAVVSTDRVLVAFLQLCRLSHILSSYSPACGSTKRMLSTTPTLQDLLNDDAILPHEITMNQYENLLSPISPEMEDDMSARIKKAHDELLLAAMAHAEIIISRLDVSNAISELRSAGGKKIPEATPQTNTSVTPSEDNRQMMHPAASDTSPVLKQADLVCLQAALNYLPTQEQSALRLRLTSVL
ncbi:hypothetical protein BGW41_007239 [Actinomortierella wolfii]|nr:hypothetical protein BGW41_007239 [Actinomortierella wolfii]